MRFTSSLLAAVLGAVAGSVLLAQAPAPLDSQFQVNALTTGFQRTGAFVEPSAFHVEDQIAFWPDGSFVVVWHSQTTPGGGDTDLGIVAQRFAADGSRIAGELQVNADTTGTQVMPTAAVLANANEDFVVVWHSTASTGTDSDQQSIIMRRFTSSGSPLGDDFQVNTYTTGDQALAEVDAFANGDFLIVWNSVEGAPLSESRFRRFGSSGSPQGGDFRANTYTPTHQFGHSAAVHPNGGFVIVWQGPVSGDSDTGIVGQRFGSLFSPIGGEFRINTTTAGNQSNPGVDAAADGSFVVAWHSYTDAMSLNDIRARRYDSSGAAISSDFAVNSYTSGRQIFPAVASHDNGGFTVAWQAGVGPGDSFYGTVARSFDSSGAPISGDFQVNHDGQTGMNFQDLQLTPSVAAAPGDTDFIVLWDSGSSLEDDNSQYSVQARRYRFSIFADGFESGDVSRWSTSVP